MILFDEHKGRKWMSNKIFDLEQEIMRCWNITDDLDDITTYFVDSPQWKDDDFSPKACDALMNKYFGLKEVYDVKFQKLWDNFEQVCREYHQLRRQVENAGIEELD